MGVKVLSQNENGKDPLFYKRAEFDGVDINASNRENHGRI